MLAFSREKHEDDGTGIVLAALIISNNTNHTNHDTEMNLIGHQQDSTGGVNDTAL